MGPAWPALLHVALALGAQTPPVFEVSPGPFERTWVLVDAGVAPRLPAELPAASSDADATWLAWAAHIRATGLGTPAARARARLWAAAFAQSQRRYDDAWSHLAQAGEDAAGLLAVLPLLVPGVAPADLAAWPRLPDGAELAPALPPPAGALDEILLGNGRVRPGSVSVSGFQVGPARIALRLSIEGDGVQVELEHLEGPAARVTLRLPVPPDFELGSVNLDWEAVPAPDGRLTVNLEPGGEPRAIYGRYRPRRIAWPTSTPDTLPEQARLDGLCLWVAPDVPCEGLRTGLGALLGLAVTLQVGGDRSPRAGVVLDLRAALLREDKLGGLISLAERFALSRDALKR